MTPEHRKRRRQVYIDKQFQLRFILKFCLILLIGIAASSMLLYFFSQGSLTSSFTNSRLVIQPTGLAMLPVILTTNLVVMALILIATAT